MAINKNHEFEELGGIKCAIVEKNASQQRVDFLKELLEINNYTVVVVPTVVKAVAPPAVTTEVSTEPPPPPPPSTFTIGVTDVTFNPINAIFGRLLKTKDGRVVSLAYWQQKESVSRDDIPYFGDVVNPA
ncbi:MAG TPA: hypothetical protein VGD17_06155 [Chitinophagaceae bacterium]